MPVNIKAGELRRRITLQRAAKTVDSVGEEILNWSDLGTYWASVTPLSGTENVVAAQLRATVSHVIHMRLVRDDITAMDRFIYKGRVLNIVSVTNTEEQNQELIFNCLEVTT